MDYRARAQAWLSDDPDPETRAELSGLLQNEAALRARFEMPLSFGTAGIRGPLGAGAARMNRRLMALGTAGLCRYLGDAVDDARARGLCIGGDARNGSRALLQEAVEVALGAGFVVHRFEAPTVTPLLAYSVVKRGAAGGLMITASHNPASDNGYKVYWEDGTQIVPPHDRAVAGAMAHIESVVALSRMPLPEGQAQGRLHALDGAIELSYRKALRARLGAHHHMASLRIAYTPLHGVGGEIALKALADAGFHKVWPVAAQLQPDPAFPTVALPNPEEPGTLDALCAVAEAHEVDLGIANDPDADRLALCVPDASGAHRTLSGNDMGALLTDYAFARAPRFGKPLMCYSLVSSPLAARIAAAYGARAEVTLTGTKWICARALALEREGYCFVCGFEEALGFVLGTLVRDKDGISAAVLAAQLASDCKAAGQTLRDRLNDLYQTHGYHHSAQHSQSLAGPDGPARTRALMGGLRTRPPSQIAGRPVTARTDVSVGRRWDASGEHPLDLPASDVLVYELEDGSRICVRPSGTEPKLKCYFDVREERRPGEPWSATRIRAEQSLENLRSELLATLGITD